MCHKRATPRGAHYFFPSASSNIDLSKDRSATNLFRSAFSRSNSFNLRPSSAAYPPQYHGWRLTTPGKTDPIFTSIHDIYHQNLLLMTGVAYGREALESFRKL
jgi:hypothetical protein